MEDLVVSEMRVETHDSVEIDMRDLFTETKNSYSLVLLPLRSKEQKHREVVMGGVPCTNYESL